MSDAITALIVSQLVAALLVAIAVAIRIRGPVGLIKNVDWQRVSDSQGLGQFSSLILTLMSAVIALHGVALYAFHADPAKRNIVVVIFIVLIVILTLAMLFGQLRYQDKQPHDGR